MQENGITVNSGDLKYEFSVTLVHWYILSMAQQLSRLSYCDVLYHEQVHSEYLLFVMFVLPYKRTFV